jgi:serine/threonine protein kinase
MSSNIEGSGSSRVDYSVQSDSSEEIVDDGTDSKLKDVQSDKKSLQSSKGESPSIGGRVVTHQQGSSLSSQVYNKALAGSSSLGSLDFPGETDSEASTQRSTPFSEASLDSLDMESVSSIDSRGDSIQTDGDSISPSPDYTETAQRVDDVAQNILGSVLVTDHSGRELTMNVVEKVGEGQFSKVFAVQVEGNQYAVMRPASQDRAEQLENAGEMVHSRAILTILNDEGAARGIQEPGKQVVNMTQFITEEGAVEDLQGSEEGVLLPFYELGDLGAMIAYLEPEHRVSVVNQLLEGSYHMMLQGVSHGDIKPGNVFLKGDPEAIEACHGDWGGAKVFNEVAGLEEHSFSNVLSEGGATKSHVVFNELVDTKELYDNPNEPPSPEVLNKVAGREMMRDHFALGQTLLEIFFTDPDVDCEDNFFEKKLDIRDREDELRVKDRDEGYDPYSHADLERDKEDLVNEQRVAVNSACDQYPEQAGLIRALVSMSDEDLSSRGNIRDAMELAFSSEEIEAIESRPGADTQLLENRLALGKESI